MWGIADGRGDNLFGLIGTRDLVNEFDLTRLIGTLDLVNEFDTAR